MKTLTQKQIKRQKLEGYFWVKFLGCPKPYLKMILKEFNEWRIISCDNGINGAFDFEYTDATFVKVDEPEF